MCMRQDFRHPHVSRILTVSHFGALNLSMLRRFGEGVSFLPYFSTYAIQV